MNRLKKGNIFESGGGGEGFYLKIDNNIMLRV